ncbi:diguanylate cyclase [Emcibacter sp. SYSU 3D8]|uniref:diguanylate cyclase n=1 Tax=Emcibacter sp. SYSU 3D8 TaxID=3133969 RepID=UPI0031FEAB2F
MARRFTIGYLVALSSIALLFAISHAMLDNVISDQRDSATVINIAGRQRMLSQRVALLADNLAAGDSSARAPLTRAINLMERSQNALIHGGDLRIVDPLSPEAYAFYFQGDRPLDPAVRHFLAQARIIASSDGDHDRSAALRSVQRSARETLLPRLDMAVSLFESHANSRITWLQWSQRIILAVLFAILAAEAILIFRPLVLRLGGYISSLTELATRDGLTGLHNRRYFLEIAQQMLLMARRGTSPTAVLALDLDNFKRINDTLGHRAGDAALRRFAEIVRHTVRRSDLIGRMGGEEFAIVLPGVDRHAARIVAEKLRRAFEEDKAKDSPPFTASIGVVLAGATDTISDLLNHADAAVYLAKQNGRNRVEFYTHNVGARRTAHTCDTADSLASPGKSMKA